LLIQLIGTGEPLRDYCIVWALGWCGDESAIPALRHFCNDASTPEFVQRIAFEALLKLSDEQTQVELRSQKIEQLPSELRDLARNDSTDFSNVLSSYLDSSGQPPGDCPYSNFAVLDTIYQIDNEHVRPALLDILRTAPLQPNYFQRIRHIFKMAEYRLDAEVFGILAYRFEKQKPMFRSRRWGTYIPGGGYLSKSKSIYNSATRSYETLERSPYEEEFQRPNARIAYSSDTREYLRRRVWRTLKPLGEEGNPDYVKMAVGILLQYSDTDAMSAKQSSFHRYNWDGSRYNSADLAG
jgi:hypothetical protein